MNSQPFTHLEVLRRELDLSETESFEELVGSTLFVLRQYDSRVWDVFVRYYGLDGYQQSTKWSISKQLQYGPARVNDLLHAGRRVLDQTRRTVNARRTHGTAYGEWPVEAWFTIERAVAVCLQRPLLTRALNQTCVGTYENLNDYCARAGGMMNPFGHMHKIINLLPSGAGRALQ